MQQITQMHKIRQQHQNFSSRVLHTNNGNNNNNNINNTYHHQHYRNNNNNNNNNNNTTSKHLQYTQQQDKSQQQQPKYLQQNPTNVAQSAAHMAMMQQPPLPPQSTHAPLHQHQSHYHHGGPLAPPPQQQQQQPQPQYYAHATQGSYHLPPQGNDGHVIVASSTVQNASNAQPCGNKPPPSILAQQQHLKQQHQQVYLGVPHGSSSNSNNNNNTNNNNCNNMRHYNYTPGGEAMPFKPVSAVITIPAKPMRSNSRQQPFNRNKTVQSNNNNNNSNTVNYNNNNNNSHDNYYNKYNKSSKNVITNVMPLATVGETNSVTPSLEEAIAPAVVPKATNSDKTTASDADKDATNNNMESNIEAPTAERPKSVEIKHEENVKVVENKSKNDEPASTVQKENDSSTANRIDNNKSNNCILSNEDHTVTNSNGKEKTPMCLVNELARFNKIVHQYRLTSENGPAHSKRFTVTLKLGDEEYTAEGFKIKKAQHLAAATAIEKTKYKHPTPKVGRRGDDAPGSRPNITPTVELNALAMKLGQQTFYVMDPQDLQRDRRGSSPLPDAVAMPPPYAMAPPPGAINVGGVHVLGPHPPPPMPPPVNYMRRAANGFVAPPPLMPPYNSYARYGQRGYAGGHVGRHALMSRHHMGYAAPPTAPQTPTKITLFVGNQKFIGTGRTLQQAKHDAAGRALEVLKAQAELQKQEALANQKESAEEGADLKSPISLVHELAIRRGMTIVFKVLREEGPAHMKNFVTACICGTIITEGDGNGKRISKKRAAEKMLVELRKLPPVTPTVTPLKRAGRIKTKGALGGANNNAATPNEKSAARKRLLKEPPETDNDLNNPITCLIQLQQTRKEKEPEFILIGKNGNENARRREFIYEVSAEGMTARGLGTSKKLAKRNAAENLLAALGVEVATEGSKKLSPDTKPTPPKAATKKANTEENKRDANEAINSNDEAQESNEGTAPVPGVLIQRQPKKKTADTPKKKEKPPTDVPNADESAKAVEEAATSNETTDKERAKPTKGVQSKQQLLYLAKILDFQVAFSDYPKGNHSEFLSIVTLTTNPPQICHGVGADSEESQNDASRNALRILSDLGIGSSSN